MAENTGTEGDGAVGGVENLDEELSGLSCHTTPPRRSMELFEAARAAGCPVAHSDEHDGFHLLLAYDDVRASMADHGLFSSEPRISRPILPGKSLPALEMDPPRHEEWRRLFSQALTPRTVGIVEEQVRGYVNERIDSFIGRGSADLVKELCEPVPAETICRLVGLDDELIRVVCDKAEDLFASHTDPEAFVGHWQEFGEMTLEEVRKRREEPRDDYLTYLANVEVEGRPLEEEEYVGMFYGWFGAGHHSTTSAMVSLIFDVFGSPRLREELRADPDLIPVAVEESLRLHPPFYGFFRRTTADTTVAEVEIPEGSDIYMGWAAANRDPQAFPEPDSFRLDRGRNRHMSFGFGIHTCPGAVLARMELRVALEELLRRVPDLHVDIDELDYHFAAGDSVHVTGLPVSFAPRPQE